MLVSRLQSALHDCSLKVAKRLAETKILVEELEDFQVSFSDTGAARVRRHDDLVLSVAVAVAFAKTEAKSAAGSPSPFALPARAGSLWGNVEGTGKGDPSCSPESAGYSVNTRSRPDASVFSTTGSFRSEAEFDKLAAFGRGRADPLPQRLGAPPQRAGAVRLRQPRVRPPSLAAKAGCPTTRERP